MWNESHTLLSRRQLLNKVSNGFGMVALSGLLGQESLGNETSRPERNERWQPAGVI